MLIGGTEIQFENLTQTSTARLFGIVLDSIESGPKVVQFQCENSSLRQAFEELSTAALPPYIHTHLAQTERYQTVYAQTILGNGSAAAPTAGLHFTPQLLSTLQNRGTEVAAVSLSVGLDTFRPIQTRLFSEHVMTGELCAISKETCDAIQRTSGRVIAVGTTSARTLETFARMPGAKGRHLLAGQTESKLFLYPGHGFKLVDGLLTNFHMPNTTMLLMVAALAGRENVMRAYAEAIQNRYRFLSFGDAMLII